MPKFDPGGGTEKKINKISDICNKNHMKVHLYNSLHLPVSQ